MRSAAIGMLTIFGLTACSDEPRVRLDVGDADTTFAGAEVNYAPDDEFATLNEDGVVKLGLTDDRVYFEVSEVLREHIDSEIETGMKESDSRIARSIGGAVRRGVQSALNIDIDFGLDEIRDVEYRDGELVFDFADPDDTRTLRNIELDEEPITRTFAAEDARAFVDAFRRVKAGESVRDENVPSKAAGAVDDKREADASADANPDTTDTLDSSGGASF